MVETEKKTNDAVIGPISATALLAKLLDGISAKHSSIGSIFLLIVVIPVCLNAQVSRDIPQQHPIYNNIERLSNLGVFEDDIQSIRPITVNRLREMVDDADPQKISSPVLRNDVNAIKRYLEHEGEKSALHKNLEFAFLKSNSLPASNLQTSSFSNPILNSKAQGVFIDQSYALQLQPGLSFDWNEWASFDIVPLLRIEESASGISNDKIRLQRTQLKLGHGDLEFSVGRIPIQWGRGISGGLTFGGSQTPLDMVQIRNSTPVTPPWFLKIFGPSQFSVFLARLDEDQVFPGNLIIGERAVIKPVPILEMGFTQSIQLAGRGSPQLSFMDVLSEVVGKRLQDINSVNLTNRNFSVDFSLRIPPFIQTTVYSEIFFEDCCKIPYTRDTSKLFGLRFPGLWDAAGSLSLEYVLTTEIYNRHGRYTSGFINRGVPLGHMLGPDADGYYLKYHHALRPSLELDFLWAYETRARNELDLNSRDIRILFPTFESPEKRMRHVLSCKKSWEARYWVSITSGFERVWNSQYIQDQNLNQYMFNLETGLSF